MGVEARIKHLWRMERDKLTANWLSPVVGSASLRLTDSGLTNASPSSHSSVGTTLVTSEAVSATGRTVVFTISSLDSGDTAIIYLRWTGGTAGSVRVRIRTATADVVLGKRNAGNTSWDELATGSLPVYTDGTYYVYYTDDGNNISVTVANSDGETVTVTGATTNSPTEATIGFQRSGTGTFDVGSIQYLASEDAYLATDIETESDQPAVASLVEIETRSATDRYLGFTVESLDSADTALIYVRYPGAAANSVRLRIRAWSPDAILEHDTGAGFVEIDSTSLPAYTDGNYTITVTDTGSAITVTVTNSTDIETTLSGTSTESSTEATVAFQLSGSGDMDITGISHSVYHDDSGAEFAVDGTATLDDADLELDLEADHTLFWWEAIGVGPTDDTLDLFTQGSRTIGRRNTADTTWQTDVTESGGTETYGMFGDPTVNVGTYLFTAEYDVTGANVVVTMSFMTANSTPDEGPLASLSFSIPASDLVWGDIANSADIYAIGIIEGTVDDTDRQELWDGVASFNSLSKQKTLNLLLKGVS